MKPGERKPRSRPATERSEAGPGGRQIGSLTIAKGEAQSSPQTAGFGAALAPSYNQSTAQPSKILQESSTVEHLQSLLDLSNSGS
jgi:hypothetical protein